jgi:O-antigen/teichoic acid export membrane protein
MGSNRGGGQFARNVAWNLLGQGAPLVVALVTIPILIRAIGTDRFGVLNLAWMVIGYFSLFDLGVGRAMTHVIAKYIGADREDEIPGVFWTGLALMVLLGIVGAFAGVIVSGWLTRSVLNIPPSLQRETTTAFYLLAVSLPITITTTGLRGALEAHQQFRVTSALRIGMGFSTFLAPMVVLPFTHSLVAIVAALIVGRSLAWTLHLVFCFRLIPGVRASVTIDRSATRSLLGLGGWMTASNIVSPLMTTADRFVLGSLVSVTAVAYYATPVDMVTKLLILPAAVTTVLFPTLSATYLRSRERAAAQLDRGLAVIFLCLAPVVLLVILFAHEGLELWLGDEFAGESTRVVQIIAIGVLANAVAQAPFALIQGVSRPDLTAKCHLIELPLFLIALWLLIRFNDIEGAAIAWSARVILDFVLLSALSRRLLPVRPPDHLKTAVAAASLVLLIGAAMASNTPEKVVVLLIGMVIWGLAAWQATADFRANAGRHSVAALMSRRGVAR